MKKQFKYTDKSTLSLIKLSIDKTALPPYNI